MATWGLGRLLRPPGSTWSVRPISLATTHRSAVLQTIIPWQSPNLPIRQGKRHRYNSTIPECPRDISGLRDPVRADFKSVTTRGRLPDCKCPETFKLTERAVLTLLENSEFERAPRHINSMSPEPPTSQDFACLRAPVPARCSLPTRAVWRRGRRLPTGAELRQLPPPRVIRVEATPWVTAPYLALPGTSVLGALRGLTATACTPSLLTGADSKGIPERTTYCVPNSTKNPSGFRRGFRMLHAVLTSVSAPLPPP